MSTCPEKDIHSIYLDNELPETYISEYEQHIKNCPKCTHNLEKLQKLHSDLKFDAEAHTPDHHFVDQSFERLQTRMHYVKVTHRAQKVSAFPVAGWTIPAVAAAVFAVFIFVPKSESLTPAETTAIHAITRAAIRPIAKNGVIVDGNLTHTTLASLFNKGRTLEAAETQTISEYQKTPRLDTFNASLTSVDVFRPDFTDGNASIAVKIAFPGMDVIPHATEVTLPVIYVAGSKQ
jgi:hypothetical protein